jgi:gas vesicle protein
VRIPPARVTIDTKEVVMKFAFGFLSGVIVGAAGAVLYSVKTGRDLREEYEQIRSDIQDRDMDALGGLLESRFKELQAMVEERIAQARETVGSQGEADALDEAEAEVAEAVEAAEAAIEEAAEA